MMKKSAVAAVLFCGLEFFGTHQVCFAQSSKYLQENLVQASGSLSILVSLADAFSMEGNFLGAQHALETALDLDPKNPILLAKLGDTYLALGKFELAYASFQCCEQNNTRSLDGIYGLMKTSRALLDWEMVKGLAKQTLKKDPDNYFALINLGWANYFQKNYEEALTWYSHPSHKGERWMRLGQGWTLLKMKKLDEAKTVFEGLLRENIIDFEAKVALKEIEKVRLTAVLDGQSLTRTPSQADLDQSVLMAREARQAGNKKEALSLLLYLLEAAPEYLPTQKELAQTYASLDIWESADYYYSVVLNKSEDEESLAGKIHSLRKLSRLGEAKTFADKLLKKDSKNETALSALGDFSFQTGDYETALNYYQQTSSEAIPLLEKKAWSFLKLKKLGEAKTIFETILKKDAKNSSALEGLSVLEKIPPTQINKKNDSEKGESK